MMFSLVGCSGSSSSSSTSASSDSSSGEETESTVKWPKNVEIIVPAGAGGDTDFNARLFAQKLGDKIDATFVVSNVNGNGGATGTRQVKDAANDGSSVLFYHSAFVVNYLSGTTDYGFDEYEFSCIAAKNPGNVITVSAESGITSIEELYAYTQEHPGELKMAVQTAATSYAVGSLMYNNGFQVNLVDAGSASERLAALLGNHVDVILSTYGAIKDYVSEGTLVPLAMDGEDDLVIEADGVDVKAMHNLGYEDVMLPFYYFFAFPKGTDQALVDEFTAAVQDIVENDADYADSIYASYYQTPTFFAGEDGLAKYQEVEDLIKDVDFATK